MIARITLVALLAASCTGPGLAPGSVPSQAPGTDANATGGAHGPEASTPTVPPPMPSGFPVHDSMEPVEPDGAYIAAWESGAMPPEVYDFYLAELAAAGFVIELEGPGGEAAIIRFSSPDGTAYQLDMTGRSPLRLALGPPHD